MPTPDYDAWKLETPPYLDGDEDAPHPRRCDCDDCRDAKAAHAEGNQDR